jgi:hypothetical protein
MLGIAKIHAGVENSRRMQPVAGREMVFLACKGRKEWECGEGWEGAFGRVAERRVRRQKCRREEGLRVLFSRNAMWRGGERTDSG